MFDNEVQLLRGMNIDVITYTRCNDEIAVSVSLPKLAMSALWSRKTYTDLRNIIRKERPDIAHFHNIWYLITPSAYFACKDESVPVVQTFHNFRVFCANGCFWRNQKICESCLGKCPWRAVLHGCFQNSRLYSAAIVMTGMIHKIIGTWDKKIDAYIALSKFAESRFKAGGFQEKKIYISPNNLIYNKKETAHTVEDYILFAGRIETGKGIFVLLDAIKELQKMKMKVILKIVGSGHLDKELIERIKKEGLCTIEYLGQKTHIECLKILECAKFRVMPSLWYEMCPVAIVESLACGKPIITSRLESLSEFVEDGVTGLLFEPGNPKDLAMKIKWMVENEDACIEMGKNARKRFEQMHAPAKHRDIIASVYKTVLKNRAVETVKAANLKR